MEVYNWVALLCIILLGIPHGALDNTIARMKGWPNTINYFFVFHFSYIVISLFVIVFWLYQPLISLIIFLLISGLHFAHSEYNHDEKINRISFFSHAGLVPVIIPWSHTEEVTDIFFLLAADTATFLISIITYLFYAWVLVFFLYTVNFIRRKSYVKRYVQLIILLILIYVLPPLVSFSIYFCLIHGPRHMNKVLGMLCKKEKHQAIKETLIYSMVTFMLIFSTVYYVSDNKMISDDLLKITFIGLAALTVPHMILVDYMKTSLKKNH
tara:strand:- start:2301 stop:3104 length:804 start_codon:yes stop_codon:yes gene_type:complete